ncbi:LSU ribosomal protein L32P [Nocardia mexicana]|uniref:Large ribosomal subunit protein bL32 n=3 Tax=Nocardia mexicana TaxID=279262 RepID=A0A370H392_9NOCA|nr:LSU ribosomal protein L32P [Nocardia mexicana]
MSSSMFRKKSRANVRSHRAQWFAKAGTPQLTRCPNPACGAVKPRQVVCPECGQYRGRQVLRPRNRG